MVSRLDSRRRAGASYANIMMLHHALHHQRSCRVSDWSPINIMTRPVKHGRFERKLQQPFNGTRAAAAERDGFTERPWRGGRGGARGACGIRRFNHPRCERDDRAAPASSASGMRDAVLLTGSQTTPTRPTGPSDAPSENRNSVRGRRDFPISASRNEQLYLSQNLKSNLLLNTTNASFFAQKRKTSRIRTASYVSPSSGYVWTGRLMLNADASEMFTVVSMRKWHKNIAVPPPRCSPTSGERKECTLCQPSPSESSERGAAEL
ncbi:unnamed protein product [Leptidea sinapis]|uniref:Uncharacterized protein n=1 Tax=Leptidea sinapis TaxID=189913 RepID=A0A5E4PTR8_9NEOP|nr:unnamed protein product [Leptidea sinapis]